VCQSCGKFFSEERKLRDHINNNVCGGQRECRFCGRIFDTQSGVRQHERKAHFNEYAAAASRDTKAEPGELLAAQFRALARAKTEIGAFPSRLAVRLGWTVDMVKYRRRLAQYKALIGDEHDRTARELREDTLSPLESSGRPPAAAAPPSTPSAGPDSPGSRLEPLGPASSPVMGSTSLSAPPMEGWPDRVVWVDPPLGKIASSPGLHISQVAGGSSAAAPLPMDSSTSSCPPSSDVSPNREVLGSPEGAAGSLLALVSPESTLAFAQDNDKYWQNDSSFSQRSEGASQSLPTPPAVMNTSAHGGDLPSLPMLSPDSGDNGPVITNSNVESDHPIYNTLRGLMDELRGPGRVKGRREVLRLASSAVGIPMDQWGGIIYK
jgi:hypothetical protein